MPRTHASQADLQEEEQDSPKPHTFYELLDREDRFIHDYLDESGGTGLENRLKESLESKNLSNLSYSPSLALK